MNKAVQKPKVIDYSKLPSVTKQATYQTFTNDPPIIKLVEVMKTVDTQSDEAKLNKDTLDDNNGGRIKHKENSDDKCTKTYKVQSKVVRDFHRVLSR